MNSVCSIHEFMNANVQFKGQRRATIIFSFLIAYEMSQFRLLETIVFKTSDFPEINTKSIQSGINQNFICVV